MGGLRCSHHQRTLHSIDVPPQPSRQSIATDFQVTSQSTNNLFFFSTQIPNCDPSLTTMLVLYCLLLSVVGQPLTRAESGPIPEMKAGIKPSRCSLEYQTVYLNEQSKLTGRQLAPPILYYPFCVRVPRCSGCCGNSVTDYQLRECIPDGIRYTSVIQSGQTVAIGNAAHHPDGSFGNGSSLIQIRRRQTKVPIHTGCRCRCKLNPLGLCPSQYHRFVEERCRCECANRPTNPELACSQSSVGPMFWDDTECRCRCSQFYTSYVLMVAKPDPAMLCATGTVLNEQLCRCVDQGPIGS